MAFVVKDKAIVVGEHQSTTSANMPVRFLMYIGLLYEKWIKMQGEEEFLYSTKLLKLPTPEFVVFYNGTTKRPDKDILRLSSAFIKMGDGALGSLELEVPVFNINKGMNIELLDKSETLRQYSEFVAKLREFRRVYKNADESARETIEYCINNGILVEFLREHGGRIVSILSAEYNEEVAKHVYGQELLEEILINMLKKAYSVPDICEIVSINPEKVLEIKKNLDVMSSEQTEEVACLLSQYGEEGMWREAKMDFLIETAWHMYEEKFSVDQVCKALRIGRQEAEHYYDEWIKYSHSD